MSSLCAICCYSLPPFHFGTGDSRVYFCSVIVLLFFLSSARALPFDRLLAATMFSPTPKLQMLKGLENCGEKLCLPLVATIFPPQCTRTPLLIFFMLQRMLLHSYILNLIYFHMMVIKPSLIQSKDGKNLLGLLWSMPE